MKRSATAKWQGGIKRGKGILNTESGALKNVSISAGQRFENDPGTNPEELLGAAHAGCFSMALSGELEKRGFIAESIDVTAEVSIEKATNGWKIPQIHLKVSAIVPGIATKQLDEIASLTKDTCPISKVLNTYISMELHTPAQESVAPQSMI